jgi:hypothetical protein
MDRREFFRLTALTTLSATLLPGCASSGSSSSGGSSPTVSSPDTSPPSNFNGRKTLLGIDVLEADGFSSLQGQRVGLVTHKAGVNGRGQRTVDVLARAPGVKLTKLFGPEHGIDGNAAAEVAVKNARDVRTGLPIYSLYGATRRPTPEMLEGLDVIVIDFQDIGSRSYTYISCMRYVIEACFSLDRPVRVVVLDRPNPLGGEKVDGPFIERGVKSYVGAYEMPYVHGLTIGEIARWAVATPGVLEISEAQRKRGSLEVISMRNWNRSLLWNQTGLNWVPTSPRIPNPQAALGYAMVGLGCIIGDFSHTYRDQMHFRFIRYGKRKSDDLISALGSSVPGLKLEPKVMPDGTQGVYTAVSNWSRFKPTAISLHMMRQSCLWDSTNPFAQASHLERDLFNKHVGSPNFLNELRTQGAKIDLQRWMTRWAGDAEAFRSRTSPYRLYS